MDASQTRELWSVVLVVWLLERREVEGAGRSHLKSSTEDESTTHGQQLADSLRERSKTDSLALLGLLNHLGHAEMPMHAVVVLVS